MADGVRRTWILGAGFSAPLGGPLLLDLFSERTEDQIAVVYGRRADMSEPETWVAVNLYRWGTGSPHTLSGNDTATVGRSLWRDAEDYLDRLDGAWLSKGKPDQVIRNAIDILAKGPGRQRIRDWIGNDRPDLLTEVVTAAKRWLADECCVFLADAELGTERWTPYRNWAESLTPLDTIITFNYDRVLELLIQSGRDNLFVVDPEKPNLSDYQTPIFKLHGSVDWTFDTDKNVFIRAGNDAARNSLPNQFGIATPGPSKKHSTKLLKPLWRRALKRLSDSQSAYFLGYRFPETDTEALCAILGAMWPRRPDPSGVRPWIVLGPNVADERTQRVAGLFRHLYNAKEITPPMYAQDFIAIHAMKHPSM